MKKITFKVTLKSVSKTVAFVKNLDNISCKCRMDVVSKTITVEDVLETDVDTVFTLVNDNFTIIEFDVDNMNSSLETKLDKTVDNHGKAETHQQYEYSSSSVTKSMRHLATCLQNRLTQGEEPSYLTSRITSLENELNYCSMTKSKVQVSVGDLVLVDFGFHLPGEICGSRVLCIVCDVQNNSMVYVVPVYKKDKYRYPMHWYMELSEADVNMNEGYRLIAQMAMLSMSRYVSARRINAVIGKVNSQKYTAILRRLIKTFNFTTTETEDGLKTPITGVGEKTSAALAEKQTSSKSNAQQILSKICKEALNKLDTSKDKAEQITYFLNNIGIDASDKWILQSFEVALQVKKITYENIVSKLCELNPGANEAVVISSLKITFKNWIEKYPEAKEDCSRISLMSLIKVYVNVFAK